MNIELPSDKQGEFQMAPMIDIVFLLIIFFMVAADMSQQERIPLEIPVAENSIRPEDPSGRGVVSIDVKGDVYAGTEKVEMDQLSDLTKVRLKENPAFKVLLRADRKTPHKYVREVMRVVAEAGVADIVFASYASE